MQSNRFKVCLLLLLAVPAATQTSPGSAAKKSTRASSQLSEYQRAVHALNRLTFGPRPGDLGNVRTKGVDAWIEDQLHPADIDDHALEARLAAYHTLRMTPQQLAQLFPSTTQLQAVDSGKKPWPADPMQRLVYGVQIARVERDKRAQQGKVLAASDVGSVMQKPPVDQAREIADRVLALPKNQRMAALEKAPAEQLIDFPNLLRPDQRDRFNAESTPEERETFYALANPTAVVTIELQQTKVLRAALSERQLQEVMTDFWFNHFNVFLYKGPDAHYVTSYERDVIRPHALGKFRDLLVAVAHSPAMLFYLDNWDSMGPDSPAASPRPTANAKQSVAPNRGLNENYGRELMELHTLGVDGGYTQADVTEVSRALTGWTIDQPNDGGGFKFDSRRHEPGDKKVLGETLSAGGEDEGMRILEMLARSPATAHFVSKKLAQRFVADAPAAALVNRMADTYLRSDGDIRQVLRTMLRSPEFWSPAYFQAKVKTPFEFVISALRASATDVRNPQGVVGYLNRMGMPLYSMAVPTGYSTSAETWMNTDALVERLNFATSLSAGQAGALVFDPMRLLSLAVLNSSDLPKARSILRQKYTGTDLALALIEGAVLNAELSARSEASIRKQMQDPAVARQMQESPAAGLRLVTGLVLGSPEFQRH
jgi:uncharacterized protein (DUF1800 family)